MTTHTGDMNMMQVISGQSNHGMNNPLGLPSPFTNPNVSGIYPQPLPQVIPTVFPFQETANAATISALRAEIERLHKLIVEIAIGKKQ